MFRAAVLPPALNPLRHTTGQMAALSPTAARVRNNTGQTRSRIDRVRDRVSHPMNAPNQDQIGLPTLGAVLAFMVDCLGIPKEGNGYSYKEIERLKKGGMASDKNWAVARKVMEAILASFLDAKTAVEILDTVFKQVLAGRVRRIRWHKHDRVLVPVPELAGPPEAANWVWDAQGRLKNLSQHLVHDWTEFLFRHNSLVQDCGSSEPPSQQAISAWAFMFVIPFLAANLVEYQFNNSRIECGMPRGRFWYLPRLLPPENSQGKRRYKWPINQVMEWWADLLGGDLSRHTAMLCALGSDADNARRQIHAWCHENRPPDLVTIDRWSKQQWSDKYAGAFVYSPDLPIKERWGQCRAFLVRKGFDKNNINWLEGMGEKPRETFRGQYRGEPLELEILPFKETTFAAFFSSADPISACLPVEELIRRIAERFAPPTNDQLRTRLILAAAFQRAFTKTMEALGENRALYLLSLFQEVYCFLTDLHNRTTPLCGSEILRQLSSVPESQVGLRYICEWLFDEDSWRTLPNEISRVAMSGCTPASDN